MVVFFLIIAMLIPAQGALTVVSNDPLADQWSYRDVKVFDAWDQATGSRDVVVAVIDNGFDTFHPELASNVWRNTREIADNGIDDDHNGYADDVWGWNFVDETNDPRPSVFTLSDADTSDDNDEVHHGTMVAGIIGAVGNNNAFGVGINWQVQLMNLKVLGNSGMEEAVVPIAKAIRYAVDNGAHIINISLIGPPDELIKEAVQYAYTKGVAIIAAAGNDYYSLDDYPRYPICADRGLAEQWVLGVSAIDESHHLARFSNTGGCIDMTAPGVRVSTTLRYSPRFGLDRFYGGPFSGTSFAAPFVSGAAALIKSLHPEWGPKEIYHTLLSTVHKTPPQDEAAYARSFGKGLLQINKAVALALASVKNGHPLKRLWAVSSDQTSFVATTPRGGTLPLASSPRIKGIESLVSFDDQGKSRYAVVVRPNKKKLQRDIRVFSGDWQQLESWKAPFSGPVSVSVGDVVGDGRPRLILAPQSPSTIAFTVRTLRGEDVETVTLAAKHAGSAITVQKKKGKPTLIAVYAESGTIVLHRFDESLQVTERISLPEVTSVGAIALPDLTGDGEDDYVIGSLAGDAPYLTYYKNDGTYLRKFFAYNDSYRGGLALAMGDYDNDGKDDVIVAPSSGGQPVRIWSARSKKLADWQPFGEGYNGPVGLLAWY